MRCYLNVSHAWALRLLLGLLCAVLLFPTPVGAHANLTSANPAAGAVLAVSPPELTLTYSEELDASFAKVRLFDARGQLLLPGPGSVDAEAPHVLRLPLGTLPDGVYTAVWQVRSAVDGHITNGSIGFAVGLSTQAPSLLPPPGSPDPALALPSPADILLRWAGYASLALALGSLCFGLLIWRPAYRWHTHADPSADAYSTRLLQRFTVAGSTALALATLGFVALQAVQLAQTGLAGEGATALIHLLAGRLGWLMALRLVLLALLVWLVWPAPSLAAGSARRWWLALLCGAGVLLSFSLQSHSAALGSPVALALDWLHLAAAVIWLGGLLPLLVLLHPRHGLAGYIAALVARFSRLALLCVVLLALTGIASANLHVRTPEALSQTSYGYTLIVKLALFGVVLLLGAINLLLLTPRLQRAANGVVRWLGHSIRGEIAIGLLVLLSVGVLTGAAPAYEALEARQRQGFLHSVQSDALNMTLRIAPARIGDNEFAVDIIPAQPSQLSPAAQVLLRFVMLDHGMGITQVEATTVDGRRYTTRGSYLSMHGRWQVEVILRRAGVNDVRQVFELSPALAVP